MKQKVEIAKREFWFVLMGCLLGFCSGSICQTVFANDAQVSNDLKYSRDALLKQRSELQSACDRKASQVSEIQGEINRLHRYLEDTDRSLHYIDSALSSGS